MSAKGVPAVNDLADMYLISLARQMRNEDVLHIGASQFDVWQASEVARRLWAPGLRQVAAGTYMLGNQDTCQFLRSRTYTRDLMAARQATFTQSRVFDDLHRSRVVFAGGMQVDVLGNANLIGFGEGGHYVRGPGSGGLPTLTSHSPRFFIAVPRHRARVLVESVQKISVLGDRRERARCGLPANALQEVITPIASFRPGPADQLELVAANPDVSFRDVQKETGFEVRLHPDFRPREPLSNQERSALAAVRAATRSHASKQE